MGRRTISLSGSVHGSLIIKRILVKLIDEFDFILAPSKRRPDSTMAHKFIWLKSSARTVSKRSAKNSGIAYYTVLAGELSLSGCHWSP